MKVAVLAGPWGWLAVGWADMMAALTVASLVVSWAVAKVAPWGLLAAEWADWRVAWLADERAACWGAD